MLGFISLIFLNIHSIPINLNDSILSDTTAAVIDNIDSTSLMNDSFVIEEIKEEPIKIISFKVNSNQIYELSEENNIKINPVNNIGELDENIPMLGQQRSIVRWAYDENTDKGDIKRFSLQKGGYVIAMLTSINDNGMMSYDKSSITALPKVKNQKKAQKIIQSIKSTTLDEIATQNNVEVQTALSVNINNPVISGVGNEPAVVGYAMGINKDITSAAIIGNSGVFYIYVTDRRKASSLANYQNMINIISSTRSSNVRNKAYNALKEKAEIEDFRGTFY